MKMHNKTFYVIKNIKTNLYFKLDHTPSYSVIENNYYKKIEEADIFKLKKEAMAANQAHHPCFCDQHKEDSSDPKDHTCGCFDNGEDCKCWANSYKIQKVAYMGYCELD